MDAAAHAEQGQSSAAMTVPKNSEELVAVKAAVTCTLRRVIAVAVVVLVAAGVAGAIAGGVVSHSSGTSGQHASAQSQTNTSTNLSDVLTAAATPPLLMRRSHLVQPRRPQPQRLTSPPSTRPPPLHLPCRHYLYKARHLRHNQLNYACKSSHFPIHHQYLYHAHPH
ncbi:uncharacterized protein LOC112554901 [Pomacea canaliculata]|uniref:uncharacterized protein LOC112554901 n=1 Tax=Pomacea canaliculata TaxID=400727 RepID=UPI000D72C3AB|nr:uncharacterized protein LOC112554901 [Pomacea canaliculata]